jgi:exosome complex component RRP4
VQTRRYGAELGDVVVGRVTDLAARRWAVDVGAATRASLQLGAVALPGDVQRRRTAEDELAMRGWFREGDVLVAEARSASFRIPAMQ